MNEEKSMDAFMLLDQVRNDGIEDSVSITLEKKAGSYTCKRSVTASSTAAAVNAIGLLVIDVAKELEIPPTHVLAVLTTVLLGPNKPEA